MKIESNQIKSKSNQIYSSQVKYIAASGVGIKFDEAVQILQISVTNAELTVTGTRGIPICM